jgi:hypothetical protein
VAETVAQGGPQVPPVRKLVLLFIAGLAITLLAYLATAVPGSWFPSASEHFWTARDLKLARGTGSLSNQEWVLQSPDASSVFVLSGTADLRSADYRVITWIAVGLPQTADARLLWRNDYEPDKVHSAPMTVESGRLRPVSIDDDPAWVGRISGVALVIRGPLVAPVRVRGAIARPMGAVDVLRDRAREWFAFEGWTGTSINTVVGGADVQDFPLTFAVAFAVVIALGLFALLRWRRGLSAPVVVTALATLTVLGWLLLDLRWTAALARQSIETRKVYGGKDNEGRHQVAEDAELYRLVSAAKALMPNKPQRVFIAAGAHYFRGRAAYHLYPHNVYFDPRADRLPPASDMHAGDWLFVYDRPGIQFDRTQNMLRWEGGQTHAAELKLLGQGGALFRLL